MAEIGVRGMSGIGPVDGPIVRGARSSEAGGIPQGLKPEVLSSFSGTTKVVPFQSPFFSGTTKVVSFQSRSRVSGLGDDISWASPGCF
jgi:hypothetical protein